MKKCKHLAVGVFLINSLKKFLSAIFVAAVILAASPGAGRCEQQMVPRIDDFYFAVDCSGSMQFFYLDTGILKIDLAKTLLQDMNQLIPTLDYEGALYKFAHFAPVSRLQPYQQTQFGTAIEQLSSTSGNKTNLGMSLNELEGVLTYKEGKKSAIILVSDGGQNVGESPVPAARNIYAKHDTCIHIISYADNEEDQATLDSIAALNDCTINARAETLMDPATLEDFVHQVFWTMADVVPEPEPTPEPVTMELKVEFDTNKAYIRPEYYNEIAKLARFLTMHPDTHAAIAGHTDSRSSDEYNIGLSQRRADSVRQFLIDRFNITPERLSIFAHGEKKPVADNESEEGMQRNRRVEVVITNMP